MRQIGNRSCTVFQGVGHRILRFWELQSIYNHPWSRMHTDREEKAGRFPKRVQIGPNSVGWVEAEYVAWQAERIAARGQAEAA